MVTTDDTLGQTMPPSLGDGADVHLQTIQALIESVYDVRVGHDVVRFLVTDDAQLQHIESAEDSRKAEEKLLVAETDGVLELSLFLDAGLLDRLGETEADQAKHAMHKGLLNDYCVALEGVSHFVYLTHNATHDRPVTMLELELQAEVDKYVAVANDCTGDDSATALRELRDWLFHEPVFDPRLSRSELDRYRAANELAGKFCAHIERRYVNRGRIAELTNCLRRFYRLSQRDKLDWIASVQ